MNIIFKTFAELSTSELYDILKLRADVFVVEQDCVYQDLDNLDQVSTHLYLEKENKILAYARLLPPNSSYENYASIGRILNPLDERKKGYGHKLMEVAHQFMDENYPASKIKIAAQEYLHDFYERHGYKQIRDRYMWDGIWHIDMIRSAKSNNS